MSSIYPYNWEIDGLVLTQVLMFLGLTKILILSSKIQGTESSEAVTNFNGYVVWLADSKYINVRTIRFELLERS